MYFHTKKYWIYRPLSASSANDFACSQILQMNQHSVSVTIIHKVSAHGNTWEQLPHSEGWKFYPLVWILWSSFGYQTFEHLLHSPVWTTLWQLHSEEHFKLNRAWKTAAKMICELPQIANTRYLDPLVLSLTCNQSWMAGKLDLSSARKIQECTPSPAFL